MKINNLNDYLYPRLNQHIHSLEDMWILHCLEKAALDKWMPFSCSLASERFLDILKYLHKVTKTRPVFMTYRYLLKKLKRLNWREWGIAIRFTVSIFKIQVEF